MMILRPLPIIGMILLAISAAGMFQIKYRVQNLAKDLKEIEQQLAFEKEAQHVLKAEWTYLNDPERLRTLAHKYLEMDYIDVAQIKTLGDKSNSEQPMGIAAQHQAPTAKPILSSIKISSR